MRLLCNDTGDEIKVGGHVVDAERNGYLVHRLRPEVDEIQVQKCDMANRGQPFGGLLSFAAASLNCRWAPIA